MAAGPEKKVKDKIKAWLNTLPSCWFFMPVANGMGKAGVPDIIVCLHGRFVGIEVKRPGAISHATELQQLQINGINNAGGVALVTDSLEHCILALTMLKVV